MDRRPAEKEIKYPEKKMEDREIFALVLAIGGGAFCILASIFNWAFFFENPKAKIFLTLFGRNGARAFYSILGLFLFFMAYKILTK